MTARPWNKWDAELADVLEDEARKRGRKLPVLEEPPTSWPVPGAASGPVYPLGGSSSAAPVSEPNAPVRVGPATTNGKSSAGPSGAAALDSLSTGKLRSIVTRARELHGHKRGTWSVRERAAFMLLNTRGMAA